MESHDYDLVRQEAREEEDRQIYQDQLDEFKSALEDCICQANKDEIDSDDIVKAIEEALEDCQDMKFKIERV